MITPPSIVRVRLTNPLELIRLIMALRILPPDHSIGFMYTCTHGTVHGRLLATHPGSCEVSVLLEKQCK